MEKVGREHWGPSDRYWWNASKTSGWKGIGKILSRIGMKATDMVTRKGNWPENKKEGKWFKVAGNSWTKEKYCVLFSISAFLFVMWTAHKEIILFHGYYHGDDPTDIIITRNNSLVLHKCLRHRKCSTCRVRKDSLQPWKTVLLELSFVRSLVWVSDYKDLSWIGNVFLKIDTERLHED